MCEMPIPLFSYFGSCGIQLYSIQTLKPPISRSSFLFFLKKKEYSQRKGSPEAILIGTFLLKEIYDVGACLFLCVVIGLNQSPSPVTSTKLSKMFSPFICISSAID